MRLDARRLPMALEHCETPPLVAMNDDESLLDGLERPS